VKKVIFTNIFEGLINILGTEVFRDRRQPEARGFFTPCVSGASWDTDELIRSWGKKKVRGQGRHRNRWRHTEF